MWPQRKYLSPSHSAKPFIVSLSHEEAFAAKSITSHSTLDRRKAGQEFGKSG